MLLREIHAAVIWQLLISSETLSCILHVYHISYVWAICPQAWLWCISCIQGGYHCVQDFYIIPLNLVTFLSCMSGNCRFVECCKSVCCLVLFYPGCQVSSRLSHIKISTDTVNLVNDNSLFFRGRWVLYSCENPANSVYSSHHSSDVVPISGSSWSPHSILWCRKF